MKLAMTTSALTLLLCGTAHATLQALPQAALLQSPHAVVSQDPLSGFVTKVGGRSDWGGDWGSGSSSGTDSSWGGGYGGSNVSDDGYDEGDGYDDGDGYNDGDDDGWGGGYGGDDGGYGDGDSDGGDGDSDGGDGDGDGDGDE